MARTVNALKFQLTLFSLDEYGLLKEGVHLFFFFFSFCTFNTISHFPIGMLFSF